MALECITSVPVKDCLNEIIATYGFNNSAQLTVDNLTTSKIGNSCIVTIQQPDKPAILRLFVKYLSNTNSSSTSTSLTNCAEVYFNNESVFYGEIINQFRCLKQTTSLTCISKCYGVGKGQDPFIIMEALDAGYVGQCVKESLSLDVAEHVLQQLGQFHAYSFAMKDQYEFCESTSRLKETLFVDKNKRIFLHGIHDAFKLLKNSLPSNSFYVERFANFILGVYDCLVALCQEDEEYKVVTHGDLWSNNILWNRSLNLVKFIDFQALRYSSPVHDLMMILLIGVDKETRESQRCNLIKIYHDSLCTTLKKLNCDPVRIFPMSVLQAQIIKHTKFTMGVALAGLPLLFNEDEIAITSTSVDDDDDARIYEFFQEVSRKKSVKCKSKMLEIIMDVIDQGCL